MNRPAQRTRNNAMVAMMRLQRSPEITTKFIRIPETLKAPETRRANRSCTQRHRGHTNLSVRRLFDQGDNRP
jgi:hypothetical protein